MPDLHPSHDLETLLDFIDGEGPVADADALRGQIASCTECAGIVADLRALAVATRATPTPARPRDFRLTPADAARLATAGAATAAHPSHDPALVSASIDGALDAADQPVVAGWLATCAACAQLRDDLLAIVAAHRALPTPPRQADYQLSQSDAARVGRMGWRGWLARVGTSRDGLTRPLATGLTALGIVGLLISAGPLAPLGGSQTRILSTVGAAVRGPADQAVGGSNSAKSGANHVELDPGSGAVYGAASAPSPVVDTGVGPVAPVSQPAASAGALAIASPAATTADDASAPDLGSLPSTPAPVAPTLLIVSVAALLIGLVLFAARRLGRGRRAP